MNVEYNIQSQEYTASDVVHQTMTDYTLDVARKKVPHCVDGLKSIHRRILWTLGPDAQPYDFELTETFVGQVIKLHPVGDQSIADTVIRMMQSFSMGLALINGGGNIGRYSASKGAAPRYLHSTISEIAKDLFFTGVNMDTIPMVPDENVVTLEPQYLIPRLPTAMLLAMFTLGSGIKSIIYPLYLPNVCELVKLYIDYFKAGDALHPNTNFSKHSHLFIPDIPIDCTINNVHELLERYKNGKYDATISIDSDIDILQNKIISHSIPFGQQYSKFITEITDKIHPEKTKTWLSENCTEFHNGTTDRTSIELEFKKSLDIFEVYDNIKSTLRYRGKLTPINNFISRENYPFHATYPVLLNIWFNERKKSIIGGISYERSSLMKQIKIKEVEMLLFDKREEVKAILEREKDVETCVEAFRMQFGLTPYQALLAIEKPVKSFNIGNKNKLEKDIQSKYADLIKLTEQSKSPEDIIYKDAEFFLKKYKKPRVTKITEYAGYILVDNHGIVQWNSVDDACKLISSFKDCKCFTYSTKAPYRKLIQAVKYRDNGYSVAKIAQGSRVIEQYNQEMYTVIIRDKKLTCLYASDIQTSDLIDSQVFPVTKSFFGITESGKVIDLKASGFLAKRVSRRGNKSEYTFLSVLPNSYQTIVLLLMNSLEPNKLQFIRISPAEQPHVRISPMGTTEIIGYIPQDSQKPCIFNLPEWSSTNMKYVLVNNIQSLFSEGYNYEYQITRKSPKNDSVSTMLEL